MRPLVVTTCAARKRATPSVLANQLQRGPQAAVTDQWLGALRGSLPMCPAADLYAGRSFGLATSVANGIHADVGIISAGLGYVTGHTSVPSYDLTISPRHANSIQARIDAPFDFLDWWRSLRRSRYATSFSEDAIDRPLIIFCLSASYARLFRSELVDIASKPELRERTRIFGLSLERHLPRDLHDNVMPYDERLNSIGQSGTRVDFAQRAAADFIGATGAVSDSIASARAKILTRMQSGRLQDRPTRRRLSDAEILDFIAAAISRVGSKPTALLHYLRHTAGAACEQSRFRRLLKLHEGRAH